MLGPINFVAGYLLERYYEQLVNRYSLEERPEGAVPLLDAIGKKRGCLRKGGVVDYDRTSKIFLTDLRSGALGGITLETPEEAAQEMEAMK